MFYQRSKMNKGKYLALDFGDRRVGVAISDLNKELAFPRDALTYAKQKELVDELKTFCETESVTKVVIGLPIQMDGTLGERVKKTYAFGQALGQALKNVPVEYFDERLTTKAAQRSLGEKGIKAKDQKNLKDSLAAQLILETYLKSRIHEKFHN